MGPAVSVRAEKPVARGVRPRRELDCDGCAQTDWRGLADAELEVFGSLLAGLSEAGRKGGKLI